MNTIAERLQTRLQEIATLMDQLLDISSIDWVTNRMRRMAAQHGFVVMMSDGRWGPSSDEQKQLQRQLLERWTPWIEQMELLFSQDTPERQRTIKEGASFALAWIQRQGHEYSIPRTTKEAKNVFEENIEPLREVLRALGSSGTTVVPDTNILLRSPEIQKYGAVLGTDKFTVLLVPSVLRELDSHKVNHKNENVREKARKFSDRIKGWRKQGDLSVGVKVQGKVYVRVEGREPDFKKTLSWLDPNIEDDRIIVSILELQRRNPTDRIVLLTGDTIMLAKADSAHIPTEDTPEPDL